MRKSHAPVEPQNVPLLIGYARVSTEDQKLDLQTDALLAAGVHPDHLYLEKKSAVKARPKLDLAIKDLREGETLVVWRIDRLARNMGDLYRRLRDIKEMGGKFRSLQEDFDFGTYMGEFVLGIFGLVAQLERQLTSHRTSAGIAALKARGGTYGRTVEFTEDLRDEAKAMVEDGEPVRAVCEQFKISPPTFYSYFVVQRIRYKRPRPDGRKYRIIVKAKAR